MLAAMCSASEGLDDNDGPGAVPFFGASLISGCSGSSLLAKMSSGGAGSLTMPSLLSSKPAGKCHRGGLLASLQSHCEDDDHPAGGYYYY